VFHTLLHGGTLAHEQQPLKWKWSGHIYSKEGEFEVAAQGKFPSSFYFFTCTFPLLPSITSRPANRGIGLQIEWREKEKGERNEK
jgi:hypothetical protein